MPFQKGNKDAAGGKLNDKWVECFNQVVNEGFNSIYMSDDDLRVLTNELYGKDDYICRATFENWKVGKLEGMNISMFLDIYKKALSKQKKQLFIKLQTDDRAWQRWAWIIERKFDEWNIKQKVDQTTNLNVVALPDVHISGAD